MVAAAEHWPEQAPVAGADLAGLQQAGTSLQDH